MKHRSFSSILVLSFSVLSFATLQADSTQPNFRPPAVPLVTSSPYFSIWSTSDHLTDSTTQHWTHADQPLVSLIRIDGKTFRLMGNDPGNMPVLPQTGLRVTPTRSIYDFDDSHVHVTLTFMTPLLPDDLDVLSRPVTYLTWDVHSVDRQNHAVALYDSTSVLLTVDDGAKAVTWGRETAGSLLALKAGANDQTLFEPRGDGVRINWGYVYAAAPADQAQACIGGNNALIDGFKNGSLPTTDDAPPQVINLHQPVLAFAFDLGSVGSTTVSRHILLAYDEIFAVNYGGHNLLPYWKRNGGAIDLLQSAENDYPSLVTRCQKFDNDLTTDLTKVGGEKYAQICALAYRECLAANGLAADANKQPLLFTKENTSNGDIATVDVIFPMAPIFLLLSPTLAKAAIAPVMIYAASERWKFPNAPHDLGTYPVAFATGEASEEMPVEESGNLLILCDAIAQASGDTTFLNPWWPQLTQWAKFLEQYGLDPADQTCTDDFMGGFAHNANLSVKAILALAAYGDLCQRRGDAVNAKKYLDLARADAAHWVKVADDGTHFRLAFDKKASWSQKYNLVWDKILGLNIFPPSVAQKEVGYYKTILKPYGLPLDSRTDDPRNLDHYRLTKTDWSIWTATLADSPGDFERFISPIYDYLNQTTARDPIADSYHTNDLKQGGMHARPVVGGFFIKMLSDPEMWKKWASADKTPVGPWAPMPSMPVYSPLFSADNDSVTWRYTIEKPLSDWNTPGFDDSKWDEGKTDAWLKKKDPHPDPKVDKEIRDAVKEVWIRRKVKLPHVLPPNLQFLMSGHGGGDIFINGVHATGMPPWSETPTPFPIHADIAALLKPDAELLIAVNMHDGWGHFKVDFGVAGVTLP